MEAERIMSSRITKSDGFPKDSLQFSSFKVKYAAVK